MIPQLRHDANSLAAVEFPFANPVGIKLRGSVRFSSLGSTDKNVVNGDVY